MPRRLVLTALALLTVVLVTSCSSDAPDDDAAATSVTTVSPVDDTTATSAPASATTAPTSSATLPPGQPPQSDTDATAQQAGQRLLDAWQAGDIDAAAVVVGSDVANAIFSYPTPEALESLPCRGSETVDAATECDFSYPAGTVTLLITGNAGNGYRVTNVGFVPAE